MRHDENNQVEIEQNCRFGDQVFCNLNSLTRVKMLELSTLCDLNSNLLTVVY
jgi:hypothetical protein